MLDPFSLLEDPPLSGGDSPAVREAVGEIPRETLLAFVAALVFAHVGLFAVSLGLMLGYFRAQWLLGGALAAGGFVALGAAVAAYRWHERVREE